MTGSPAMSVIFDMVPLQIGQDDVGGEGIGSPSVRYGRMPIRVRAHVVGEILRITNAQIDYKREMIKLPKFAVDHRGSDMRGTKTGEPREVPITPRLMEKLGKLRFLGASKFVFGKADGRPLAPHSLRKPWSTLKLIAYGYKPTYASRNGAVHGRWFDGGDSGAIADYQS